MRRQGVAKSNLRKNILRLLRDDLSSTPEEIAQRLFPSLSRDSREFAAKTRLVKKVLPTIVRVSGWRRRSIWAIKGLIDSSLFKQLSLAEERGRKVIGGKSDPCQCVVSSDGKVKVKARRRFWRGWLIQQLASFGWANETAEKHVMNLLCHSKTSDLRLNLPQILKKLGQFTIHDPETGIGLKVRSLRLAMELSPEHAGVLQSSWDRHDEALNKLRSAESSQVVLASVSAFRIDKVLQGLGLNPQQVKQASDTLVTVGVEDRHPDFIYLMYGPPSAKPRQIGVRALITPLPNYEIRLGHPQIRR